MMTRVKIAAVSYLNTIPFIYGIEHSAKSLNVDLLLSPPNGCAEAMANGLVDIALIPVAEIPSIDNIEIIGSWCIGAHSVVRTVVLLSNSPVNEIKTIYLDPHSRTSQALTRILARELWNINPEWLPIEDYSDIKPSTAVGYLLIGDKVFNYENQFKYNYDLASEWISLTNMPFVFAAWVARKDISKQTIKTLDNMLKYGVEHIKDAVKQYSKIDYETSVNYLTQNIDFILDSTKREALEFFWKKHRENAIKINPG